MPDFVSIVMAVHNGEKYLTQTMKSLLAQTHEDFELLIMDDGSDDLTGEFLRSFFDPRIKIFTQPQAGLTVSLNRLIENAKGNLIARADADDLSLPRRLEKQVAYFAAHPEVGVMGTFYDTIDANGKVTGQGRPPANRHETLSYLKYAPPFAHPSTVFKKALFDKAGGYDPAYPFAQDYDLWTRLAPLCAMENLPENLISYRIHAQAATASKRERQLALHKQIRMKYWRTLPVEAKNETGWAKALDENLEAEQKLVGNGDSDLPETYSQRRIAIANLACGANRPDIGLRCMFEIGRLKGGAFWRGAYQAAKTVGFETAWSLVKKGAANKFRRARISNPLFE